MDHDRNLDEFSGDESVGPNTDMPLSQAEKVAEYDRLVLENQALKVRLRKVRNLSGESTKSSGEKQITVTTSTLEGNRVTSCRQETVNSTTENWLMAARVVNTSTVLAKLADLMAIIHAFSPDVISHSLGSFLLRLPVEIGRAQKVIEAASVLPFSGNVYSENIILEKDIEILDLRRQLEAAEAAALNGQSSKSDSMPYKVQFEEHENQIISMKKTLEQERAQHQEDLLGAVRVAKSLEAELNETKAKLEANRRLTEFLQSKGVTSNVQTQNNEKLSKVAELEEDIRTRDRKCLDLESAKKILESEKKELISDLVDLREKTDTLEWENQKYRVINIRLAEEIKELKSQGEKLRQACSDKESVGPAVPSPEQSDALAKIRQLEADLRIERENSHKAKEQIESMRRLGLEKIETINRLMTETSALRARIGDLEWKNQKLQVTNSQLTGQLEDRKSQTGSSSSDEERVGPAVQSSDQSDAATKICRLEAALKMERAERDAIVQKVTLNLKQDLVQELMRVGRLTDEVADQKKTIERLTTQLEDAQDIIAALQTVDT